MIKVIIITITVTVKLKLISLLHQVNKQQNPMGSFFLTLQNAVYVAGNK